MKRMALFAVLFILFTGVQSTAAELPHVTHYSLQIQLFPAEARLEAGATLTVNNRNGQAVSELPFLLYRLVEVQDVFDDKGSPLKFEQTIVRLDGGNLQANLIRIHLPAALGTQSETRLTIRYRGAIFGYPEVMAYVNDRIDENYSLLRPDSLAYPMLAGPTHASWQQAYGLDVPFTYDAAVTVPDEFVVACGGTQLGTAKQKGRTTFSFRSKVPTWRIDIAVAKFKQLNDETKKVSVYVLPEDEKAAAEILNGAGRVVSLYSKMFGELQDYQGYTVIEIPDGWGSQASDYYFLQTAAAFKNLERMVEVYHEIAHSWNVKARPEIRRTRWFDEAFAMYFQALALREFEGEPAFIAEMARDRESFIRRVGRDRKNAETPIADYGKFELGANSYSKGAWSLYVLHQLVGEETFRQIIRAFLSEFRNKMADFKDFQAVAERVSQRKLDKYFQEWIYGAVSSQLLLDKVPITNIVARY